VQLLVSLIGFSRKSSMGLEALFFQAAERTGAIWAMERSEWRRRRLLVLCYHGVSIGDEHEWNPSLYVSQDHLRLRLEYLRARRYAILPLDEALQRLQDGSLPRRSIAITFDDGTRDFSERALPVLRAYDVPATLYLTTYYVDRALPVFDTALSYLLWAGRASRADLSGLAGVKQPLFVTQPEDRRTTWEAFQRFAEGQELTAVGKHDLLARLAACLGIDFGGFLASGILQMMTAAQIRALPRDLIQLELHTHRHRAPRDRELFMRELKDNQARISALTDDPSPRRHFCYPSGDYDGRFFAWLSELGVQSATTCIPGLASASDHRLLVPRFVDAMNVSMPRFAAWASGVAALVPRRSHRLDPRALHGHSNGASRA
jgi:peptidoglycan/xylan/chitin deacetylase (PgdA/CDA1 family)